MWVNARIRLCVFVVHVKKKYEIIKLLLSIIQRAVVDNLAQNVKNNNKFSCNQCVVQHEEMARRLSFDEVNLKVPCDIYRSTEKSKHM